jgi:hypothetical protein
VLAIVILELAAGAMLWLALRTAWPARAAPPPASAATPPEPERSATTSGSPTSRPAVPLARRAGAAIGKARDDGPRQLGRLVGRAQRAAKAAMAPEPPAEPDAEPTAGPPPSP